MPSSDAPASFAIPGGFDPRWSLLGQALRRWTGDRLRAEALQVVLLTGAALLGLMGPYAAAEVPLLALQPLTLGAGLAVVGGGGVLGGLVGFRPQTVVTAGPTAVTAERGRERLRLPYAALEEATVVEARRYHRHERRYAAVRPFLGDACTPVLLLWAEGGETVAALGLRDEDREALRRHVERRIERGHGPRCEQPRDERARESNAATPRAAAVAEAS